MSDLHEREARPAPGQRTPVTEGESVISALCDIWEMVTTKPGDSDLPDFWETIFNRMWADKSTTGEKQYEELVRIENLTHWEGEPIKPDFKAAIVQIAVMQLSCAFAIQAINATKGSRKAWAYACEANHWLGILQGTFSGRGMERDNRKFDFSTLGKMGAEVLHGPIKKLREYALSLFKPHEWKSANQAAFALQEQIMAYGKTIGAHLSPANAQRTIAGWFRKSSCGRHEDTSSGQ